MIAPNICSAPLPNEDIPSSCRDDYLEAREIAAMSPKGAAALLRLCIQKLCLELGEQGHDINHDIASLVSKGLPASLQKAFDVVRIIGNNAVHPGKISVGDKPEIVVKLFDLVNIIIDNRITQPRHIEALYDTLPEGPKAAIVKRDNPK